jgi:homoserine dehydrogenase
VLKLALIGFGFVAQGLAEILLHRSDELRANLGFSAQIVAVATRSRGSLYRPDGLVIDELFTAIHQGRLDQYPDVVGLERGWDTMRMIRESSADVVIEATPSNFQTGQPALDYCHAALDAGKHLVMANKGPLVVAYHDLVTHARQAGRQLRFEATVMAGTPTIHVGTSALAGCHISEARGILNGTTNYILTQMESGMSYAEALAQAQKLGYAEADPSADVDGWDAAAKALILAAALFNSQMTLADFSVKGISGITLDNVQSARTRGERWKLVARVTPAGGSVQPVCLPISDPLANVMRATNAVTYTTDHLGDVTLIGPGAGRSQTGFGLLADLLEIHRAG